MHANQGSLNHLISGWWHKQTPPPHLPTLSYPSRNSLRGVESYHLIQTRRFSKSSCPLRITLVIIIRTPGKCQILFYSEPFSQGSCGPLTHFLGKVKNSCGIITVWSTQKALHGQIWTNPQAENLIIACFISYLKQARNRHSKSKLQSKLDAANWQQHPSSCL